MMKTMQMIDDAGSHKSSLIAGKRKRGAEPDGRASKKARTGSRLPTGDEIHAALEDVGARAYVRSLLAQYGAMDVDRIFAKASLPDRIKLNRMRPKLGEERAHPEVAPADRGVPARVADDPVCRQILYIEVPEVSAYETSAKLAPKRLVYFGAKKDAPNYRLSNLHSARLVVRWARVPSKIRAMLERQFPLHARWLREQGEAVFLSVEHLYQSLKTTRKADFLDFQEGGRWTRLPKRQPKVRVQTRRRKNRKTEQMETVSVEKVATSKMLREDAPKRAEWLDQFAAIGGHPFAASPRAEDRLHLFSTAYKQGRLENIGLLAKLAVHPARAPKLGITLAPEKTDATPDWVEDRGLLWRWILALKYSQHSDLRTLLLCTGDALLVEFGRGAKKDFLEKGQHAVWSALVELHPGPTPDSLPVLKRYGRNAMGQYHMQVRANLFKIEARRAQEEQEEKEEEEEEQEEYSSSYNEFIRNLPEETPWQEMESF